MSWFTNALTSSVGRKFVMSITGLFLISFLLVHLAGNLLLLNCDGGIAFNEYAHFMKYNTLIKLSEVILFAGFLVHIVQGIILVRSNNAARPVKYAVSNQSKTENWASKYMGPFGIVILVFLIIHLYDFFRYKYFAPIDNMPGTDISDLAVIVYHEFHELHEVIIYLVAMFVIAFHLQHGFQSAFQTLGWNHKKYTPLIKTLGTIYAIFVPLLFALIPLLIYFNVVGNGSCSAH